MNKINPNPPQGDRANFSHLTITSSYEIIELLSVEVLRRKKYGEKNSNTSAIIREAVVSYLNPSGNQEIIMAKEINDETIKYFIENHLSVEHFGYLVVTDDARMNEEALSYIKQDFREFIGSEE